MLKITIFFCFFILLPSIWTSAFNILECHLVLKATYFRMFLLYPIDMCCWRRPVASLNSSKIHCISYHLTVAVHGLRIQLEDSLDIYQDLNWSFEGFKYLNFSLKNQFQWEHGMFVCTVHMFISQSSVLAYSCSLNYTYWSFVGSWFYFWVTTRIGLHSLVLKKHISCLMLSSTAALYSPLCFSSCLFKVLPPKFPVCSDWSALTRLTLHCLQQQRSCAKTICQTNH